MLDLKILTFDAVSQSRILHEQSELIRHAEKKYEEKQASEVQNSMAILLAQRDTQRSLGIQPHKDEDPYFSLDPGAPENNRRISGHRLAPQETAELACLIMAKPESIQAAPKRRLLVDKYRHLKSTSEP